MVTSTYKSLQFSAPAQFWLQEQYDDSLRREEASLYSILWAAPREAQETLQLRIA